MGAERWSEVTCEGGVEKDGEDRIQGGEVWAGLREVE